MIDQKSAPIVDTLKKYINDGTIRFHMPGHKGRQNVGNLLNNFLGEQVFAADVTNIPGLDDLHQTHSVIKKAQAMAAETFGAECTYFLINGSSCGLQALVMAVCNPGEKILVPRNMHRSILSGIILSGAVPVFFKPEYDDDYGISLGTLPEIIAESLIYHSDIKAVFLVSPTYHGIASNTKRIAEIVHARGIPLLVDEAHGPHFIFHEELPQTALECGADASVQGIHKILGAFTQASMLHINKGSLIDIRKLESCLRLLQSTSTSYLLLASLDAARAQMATYGREVVQAALELANYLRSKILEIPGFSVLGSEIVNHKGVWDLDPTKVTISVGGLGVTGLWAEGWLRKEKHIQVEMSDILNLLLIVSFGNRQKDVNIFLEALKELRKHTIQHPNESINPQLKKLNIIPNIPELVISPREAFKSTNITLPLQKTVNRISAEVVSCYPPGIPVLCPGEKITAEIVEYLTVTRELGVHFQGCSDLNVLTLRVVN